MRMRWSKTLMALAAILGGVLVVQPAGAVTRPSTVVQSFTVSDATLGRDGGTVVLEASVGTSIATVTCMFTSNKPVAGLTTSGCWHPTSDSVTIPPNNGTKPVIYKFRLYATGMRRPAGPVTVSVGTTGPPRLAGATSVTNGGLNNCAVLNSGGVDCWGANGLGALGDGTMTSSLVPEEVDGITTANGLASDGYGYCARLISGGVDCWGDNTYGELGNGTTSGPEICGSYACSTDPVPVSGLTDVGSVAEGTFSYCAVLTSGRVDCWGDNSIGQLGNGTVSGPETCMGEACSSSPSPVSGLSGVTSVTSSGYTYCAVLTTGAVDCWGSNADDELGNGSSTYSDIPVAAVGISHAVHLASDGSGFCAVLSTGGVDCWGDNSIGQLGNGSTTNSSVPVAVTGIAHAVSLNVERSDNNYCAVLSSGRVDCWGIGIYGELGNGTTPSSSVPVAVSGIDTATSVSFSEGSYCARRGSGGIDCWGDNAFGELGNGNTLNSSIPVAVFDLAKQKDVSGGNAGFCAVLSKGGVECWGYNADGELGDGTTSNSSFPEAVLAAT